MAFEIAGRDVQDPDEILAGLPQEASRHAHNAAVIAGALSTGRSVVGMFRRDTDQIVGEVVVGEPAEVPHLTANMVLKHQDTIFRDNLAVRHPDPDKLRAYQAKERQNLDNDIRNAWF
jgi:hypothetical protein